MIHEYLSTGCFHGDHGYCSATNGRAGTKKPGVCKFCDAPCSCPCHRTNGSPVANLADYPIMRFFEYEHLREGDLRDTAMLCSVLANTMANALPAGAEVSAGLRHLLEAKDCFVRAALPPA